MARWFKSLLNLLALVSVLVRGEKEIGVLMDADVIGYYQVIMYEALGFTGGKAILVSGIYNCVGPIASEPMQTPLI